MLSNFNESELRTLLPGLQRFAYFLTRDSERAADLVQDTIERALKKEHLFDGSNLRAWLTTMCRRIFLNDIRSAKCRGVAINIDGATGEQLSVAPPQEAHLRVKEVAAAFSRISMIDKQVLSLIAIDGRSYKDAAVSIGVPVGTVRSRLSRARDHLAEAVERRNARPPAARQQSAVMLA